MLKKNYYKNCDGRNKYNYDRSGYTENYKKVDKEKSEYSFGISQIIGKYQNCYYINSEVLQLLIHDISALYNQCYTIKKKVPTILDKQK